MPTNRTRSSAQQERDQKLIEDAISSFVSQHPEVRQATVITEIPSPLKWAGMIAAGVMTTGVVTGAIWLVASVQDVQVTLARLDERVASWNTEENDKYVQLERRVSKLEDQEEGI